MPEQFYGAILRIPGQFLRSQTVQQPASKKLCNTCPRGKCTTRSDHRGPRSPVNVHRVDPRSQSASEWARPPSARRAAVRPAPPSRPHRSRPTPPAHSPPAPSRPGRRAGRPAPRGPLAGLGARPRSRRRSGACAGGRREPVSGAGTASDGGLCAPRHCAMVRSVDTADRIE
jgi:hypothetical protein